MRLPTSDPWYDFNFTVIWTFFTTAFSARTVGQQHMPRSGPVLILANHASYFDPLLVGMAVRRPLAYLARKTLFRNSVMGSYLRSVGCIPVDLDGIAKEGLRASLDMLGQGKALVVFPEGTRSEDGKMNPFKPGIALLLRKKPVPIVPVGVAGAFDSFSLHAKVPLFSPIFWPATGGAVAAAVGPLIPPDQYAHFGRDELLTFLFDRVKEQTERAAKLVRRPAWGVST